MDTLFLLCAIFGGIFLVAESILGLGGGDVDGAFDGGSADHSAGADQTSIDATESGVDASNWIFGVLSLRTMLIGLTFFGLVGKTLSSARFEPPLPVVGAVAAGLGAMYGVFFLMRGLHRLHAEGNERIARAVGLEGTVFLTIPAKNQGAGKVHLTLQNRLVEYQAMTAGERLPTGSRVIVVGVLGPDKVEVQAVSEIPESAHV